MPFFVIPLIAGLGGLFVGSQVDNAVQASASKPAIIDQSKAPWYVQYLILAAIALAGYFIIKKVMK